ncbi:hypothetical protein DOTSEDRAFT_59265 [Dothistroma septosporum NZE10]|uniref:Uncharacterized protein n=1 Tax=Dothistroma septosporum (strain NZE10 / CBS 128990) TaxID=675120 RepID=N1Q383_DOTSN|nr:hypothetical protein DOTSEDRAFT_59265 [Dothistroma septosporum NZE10]
MATRCSSPPDKFCTSWSMKSSILSGLNAALIFLKNNWRTVPVNFGVIFCGFMLIILQNVVFPVPFSPIMTRISESVKSPDLTVRLKPPNVQDMSGYPYARFLSARYSSPASPTRKVRDSSRKRKFSVGMLPQIVLDDDDI